MLQQVEYYNTNIILLVRRRVIKILMWLSKNIDLKKHIILVKKR